MHFHWVSLVWAVMWSHVLQSSQSGRSLKSETVSKSFTFFKRHLILFQALLLTDERGLELSSSYNTSSTKRSRNIDYNTISTPASWIVWMQLKIVISFKWTIVPCQKATLTLYSNQLLVPKILSTICYLYKMRGDVVNSHVLIVRSKTFLGVLQWCSSPTWPIQDLL